MSDYTPKREKDTIDAAVTSASKVPGSLTLNELNAISDKGLVVSGGSGGSATNSAFDLVLWVTDNPKGNPSVTIDGDFDSVYSKLTTSDGKISACVMSNINKNYKINYKSLGISDLYAENDCVYIDCNVSENSQRSFIWNSDGTIIIDNGGGGGGR